MNVMTIAQFSEKTGLSVKAIRKLIYEDRLVVVRTPQKYYINYTKSMKKLFNLP